MRLERSASVRLYVYTWQPWLGTSSHKDHGTLRHGCFLILLRSTDGQPISWTSDDDSGVGTNAKVVFTPTETGSYYIEASAHKRIDWDGPSVGPGAQGTYTVFLSEYTSDDSDDYSNFTDTTGAIEVGSSVQAEIETVGDQDWSPSPAISRRRTNVSWRTVRFTASTMTTATLFPTR